MRVPDQPIKRNVRRYEQDWFKLLFSVRGSVIPAVMPRVLLCAAFSVGILLLYARGWPVSSPILGSLVPSLVLGLLLGHIKTALMIGLAGGVAWYLYNLYVLQR